MRGGRTALYIIDEAEPARVVEAHDRAVVERQDHMVVLHRRKLGPRGGDTPRHAEMQQEEPGVIELDEEVFAAPRQRPDERALEPCGQHRRGRAPPTRGAATRPARAA